MIDGNWMCEEHLIPKSDTDTYFELAKITYDNYIQRRARLSSLAFEMVRVSGMIISILGAVSLFALINYPSYYLIALLPGLILLFLSIIIYLPIWKVPTFKIVNLDEIEEKYKRGILSKDDAAAKLMKITMWYRNHLLPPLKNTIELQNKFTKIGIVSSISGIIILFLLELFLR
ncbi:MAG: hypothetical protein ACOCSH_02105 [Candidatus Hadarchaeota archaeon]